MRRRAHPGRFLALAREQPPPPPPFFSFLQIRPSSLLPLPREDRAARVFILRFLGAPQLSKYINQSIYFPTKDERPYLVSPGGNRIQTTLEENKTNT